MTLTTPIGLIAFPVVVGTLCLICPDKLKRYAKLCAVTASAVSFASAVFVLFHRPDRLSGFVAAAASLFALLYALYSCRYVERSFGRYFGYGLMALGAAFGVVYTNNLIALLVAWGFLAAIFFLMVALQGTDRSAAAAKKALIVIGGTDALMLFGIALMWMTTGTFAMDAIRIPLTHPAAYVAYFSLAIAAFAKAGAMPFHSWLPDVAEDGPTPVTAYLPASLDKLLGIYLLARISTDLFVVTPASNAVLLIVGSATIVVAVVRALAQRDLKRLLGYCAVSQVGYMVLGIGTGTPIGIAGGLFHMLNHAIYKSCLFFSAGNVEKRTGTTDLEKLGGLAAFMPVTFAAFLAASLSGSGIPPFGGFVSKWMVYQGIMESAGRAGVAGHAWLLWLVAAMFGSALTVAAFMKILQAVFLGRPDRDFSGIREVPPAMAAPVVILGGLCVVFGVFAFAIPLPLFILPSVASAVAYVGVWNPLAATVCLIAACVAGALVYAFFRPGRFRVTGTFVGGEDPESMGRVSGVDFYSTIRDTPLFGPLYRKDEARAFDLYAIARASVLALTRELERLHNGILPTYLVWCLLGMVALFVMLAFR